MQLNASDVILICESLKLMARTVRDGVGVSHNEKARIFEQCKSIHTRFESQANLFVQQPLQIDNH